MNRTKEQLDLLFEYIEKRVSHLAGLSGSLPAGIGVALSEREKEIKEKLYSQVVIPEE